MDAQEAYEAPFQFDQAADISNARFVGGEAALDGCWLDLLVTFATHFADTNKKWEIWTQEAQVRLVRGGDQSRQLPLGAFRAALSHSIRPSYHSHKSDQTQVIFRRQFTPMEMTAIEKWRGKEDLHFRISVFGFGKRGTESTWGYFREHAGHMPWSQWRETLARVHYLDQVHLAISAAGDPRVSVGVFHLKEAQEHNIRGDWASVGQSCRKAIEEIGKAGFAKRAPKGVEDFIGDMNTRIKLTLEDRAAIVKLAAHLYVHPAAHGGQEGRRWASEDADLALALTAALLQLAPLRLKKMELDKAESAVPEANE